LGNRVVWCMIFQKLLHIFHLLCTRYRLVCASYSCHHWSDSVGEVVFLCLSEDLHSTYIKVLPPTRIAPKYPTLSLAPNPQTPQAHAHQLLPRSEYHGPAESRVEKRVRGTHKGLSTVIYRIPSRPAHSLTRSVVLDIRYSTRPCRTSLRAFSLLGSVPALHSLPSCPAAPSLPFRTLLAAVGVTRVPRLLATRPERR